MMKQSAGAMVFFLALCLAGLNPAWAQGTGELAPGWLSLDSTVGQLDDAVQKGKAKLEEYTFGVKISGFLDTSYTYSGNNPGYGSHNNISQRVFDKDHNQIVFNDFNITLERPEPESGWGIGGKLVGDFGRTAELLRESTMWGVTKIPGSGNGGEPSAELREAFLTTTIPVGNGIGIQGGLFVTTLGTEIIPNPGAYNDNISRSYLFGFSIPFRHVGMLISYPIHETVSVSAGPVTGWDNPKDNNRQPSFLSAVTLTPINNFSLISSFIIGPEQDDNSGNKRLAWANVASYAPTDELTLTLEYTYGHEEMATASGRDATWQGVAGYVSYNWTERFNTAVRGEYFRDADGARFGGNLPGTDMDVGIGEFTLTGAYKFTQMLLGRVEVRHDMADSEMFQKGNLGSDKNQTTFAMQAIYTY